VIAGSRASANISKTVLAAIDVAKRPQTSRRRSSVRLGKKLLVYFTEEERTIVDSAAAAERRSISSFVANAAIRAAEQTLGLSKTVKKRAPL